jgi:hypothetical protein
VKAGRVQAAGSLKDADIPAFRASNPLILQQRGTQLSYYPLPMPAPVAGPLETTGDMQKHPAASSLGKSELHNL